MAHHFPAQHCSDTSGTMLSDPSISRLRNTIRTVTQHQVQAIRQYQISRHLAPEQSTQVLNEVTDPSALVTHIYALCIHPHHREKPAKPNTICRHTRRLIPSQKTMPQTYALNINTRAVPARSKFNQYFHEGVHHSATSPREGTAGTSDRTQFTHNLLHREVAATRRTLTLSEARR